MNEEILYLWRKKLNSLKQSVPGYEGSAAEQLNEVSFQVLEFQQLRERAAAEEADPETAPIINVIGGYKVK